MTFTKTSPKGYKYTKKVIIKIKIPKTIPPKNGSVTFHCYYFP